MKGLFTSPEKLCATPELLLNRHSARKSVPVSSCLFSGLAVMDYIQPQVGHKPAVYLSFPNILLQFLYYRGANALFQDAYCIKSTYFSEYFTVTQRDWTGFFYQMLLLLPQHIPHNKSVSVPRGLQLKWQTALELFPAQKPTGRETCAPHSPALPDSHCVWNSSTSGPAVLASWTRGEKKEQYSQHSQHSPPGPSHKHETAKHCTAYKESKPALPKSVCNALWQCTQTLHAAARTQGCGIHSLQRMSGERAMNSIWPGRGTQKSLLTEFRLSTTRIEHWRHDENPSSFVGKAVVTPSHCPAKPEQFPGNSLELAAALPT